MTINDGYTPIDATMETQDPREYAIEALKMFDHDADRTINTVRSLAASKQIDAIFMAAVVWEIQQLDSTATE